MDEAAHSGVEQQRVTDAARGRPDARIPNLNARLLERLGRELNGPASICVLAEGMGDHQFPAMSNVRLHVDSKRLLHLLTDLTRIAALEVPARSRLASLAFDRRSTLELVTAAVAQDRDGTERVGGLMGVDPGVLTMLAAMTAVPVLVQARAALSYESMLDHWGEGWCRVCGGWPLLSELRGLERSRRMRCGRCGDDWELPWLQCAFCGESDHHKLCELLPQTGGERKVDGCRTCNGYVKSIPGLSPLSIVGLLAVDAESVPLDLAALAEGFSRPAPRRVTGVHLVER
ncbi:MAG: formate dehydrogenase accessory protein FdhE [Gemmatimonadota bacterium]